LPRRTLGRGSLRTVHDRPEPAEAGPLCDQPFYQDITSAQLEHLAGLDLPAASRLVIDDGAGNGGLRDLRRARCDVLCVDGRAENIDELPMALNRVASRPSPP